MADDSITIDFEITRDEYIRWAWLLQERSLSDPRWKRFYKGQNSTAAFATILTLVPIYLAYTRWTDIIDRQNTALALFTGCLGAGAAGLWWTYSQRRKQYSAATLRQNIERDADTDQARLWQGHKRVTITPAFFIWEARHCTYLQRWFRVGRITKDAEFVLMEVSGETQWPIPIRAIGDGAAVDRFIALASKHRDASPPGPALELRDLLKDRDFPCPKCSYNLRGTEGGKCPECGTPLTIDQVLHRRPPSL